MSNFTKAGSEDWQSTLTRAPLFANLFFDRLAALGSRAVNAPFRSLCFVALFDQVVDYRLLACVSSVIGVERRRVPWGDPRLPIEVCGHARFGAERPLPPPQLLGRIINLTDR